MGQSFCSRLKSAYKSFWSEDAYDPDEVMASLNALNEKSQELVRRRAEKAEREAGIDKSKLDAHIAKAIAGEFERLRKAEVRKALGGDKYELTDEQQPSRDLMLNGFEHEGTTARGVGIPFDIKVGENIARSPKGHPTDNGSVSPVIERLFNDATPENLEKD